MTSMPSYHTITPYELCLGICFHIYMQSHRPSASSTNSSAIRHCIGSFVFLQLQKSKSEKKVTTTPISYKSFLIALSNSCSTPETKEEVIHLFENQVATALASPDALEDILTSLEATTNAAASASTADAVTMDQQSIFGKFIRRLALSWNQGGFDALGSLYSALTSFVTSTDCTSVSSTAATTITNVQSEYKKYLVASLACIENRDIEGALENLHRYHDLSLRPGLSVGKTQLCSIQYASLNVAAVYVKFEYYDTALLAIQESIRLAQQNNDPMCVSYALSWAMRCNDATKSSSLQSSNDTHNSNVMTEEYMNRCGTDLKLPVLWTLAWLQCTVKDIGTTVIKPLDAWLTLQQSTALAVQRLSLTPLPNVPTLGMVAGANAAAKGKSNAAELDEKLVIQSRRRAINILNRLGGTVRLSQAVAWEVYGHRQLSNVLSLVVLQCFKHSAPAADLASTIAKLANLKLSEESTGSAYPAALELALSNGKQNHKIWLLNVIELLHGWASARKEVSRSEFLSHLALSIASDNNSDNFDMSYVTAQTMVIKTLRTARDTESALSVCKDLVAYTTSRGLVALHAKTLLLQAEIMLDSGHSLPLVATLPIVLICLSTCKQNYLDSTAAQCYIELARIFLNLGYPHKARNLINQTLPQVLEHCDLATRGKTYVVLVQCILAEASTTSNTNIDPNVLTYYLKKSEEFYTAVEDRAGLQQVYYLNARICHKVGDIPGRDAAALKFKTVTNLIKSARRTSDSCESLELLRNPSMSTVLPSNYCTTNLFETPGVC